MGHAETYELLREAREALRNVEVELAKAEYLASANLPNTAHLRDDIHEQARVLAAGLVALTRCRLGARGRESEAVQ